MQQLEINIFMNETTICFTPKSPIFFRKITNKIIKLLIPDIEVARASPAIFMGNMSTEHKMILETKVTAAFLVGVIRGMKFIQKKFLDFFQALI